MCKSYAFTMRSYMYSVVELSYLFIGGHDLHSQLLTTKSSIVCVHDNVRKRAFAIFQGKLRRGGGGASSTYHTPESATVSTE